VCDGNSQAKRADRRGRLGRRRGRIVPTRARQRGASRSRSEVDDPAGQPIVTFNEGLTANPAVHVGWNLIGQGRIPAPGSLASVGERIHRQRSNATSRTIVFMLLIARRRARSARRSPPFSQPHRKAISHPSSFLLHEARLAIRQ